MIDRCGLCGRTKKLTRTLCCGNLICDDEDKYVMFSYARNSCHRNHDRYTLCAWHFNERHGGDWRRCKQCRRDFRTEIYVYYGTNEYNFAKLENPPKYRPTRCARCGKVIKLGTDGYTMKGKEYFCAACEALILPDLFRHESRRERMEIETEAPMKTTTVTLWLRVENNNKFVRGRKRAREDIEAFHLRRYGMKKLNDVEYELTFSYEDDAHLDKQIYDLLREIDEEADCRNCFVEADARERGTGRSW